MRGLAPRIGCKQGEFALVNGRFFEKGDYMSEGVVLSSGKKAMFIASIIAAYFAAMFSLTGSAIFVSAAMAQLDGMSMFGLAVTLESLFRCVLIPPSAKLGERYLRKNLFIVGLVLFIAGAVLCVLAWNPFVVVASRAIMGLAWGLFFANMIVLVNDVYSPEKAPKINGIVQTFGFVGILTAGPISGLFVDFLTWQWTLYIVILFAALALVLILFVPNVQERETEGKPLDVAGALLTALVLIPFSLALSWGGSTYAWSDPVIIGLLVATVVFLVLLVVVEGKAQDPVFPAYLLKDKNLMMMFLVGAMFAGVCSVQIYFPTIMQAVLGFTATESSIPTTVISILALFFTSWVGSRISKTRRCRGLLFAEGIVCVISGVAMLFVGPGTSFVFVVVGFGILGISQAIHQVTPISWPSIALDPSKIAVAVAFLQFGQALASTIFNAVLGAAFNFNMLLPIYFVVGFAVVIVLCAVVYRDPKAA